MATDEGMVAKHDTILGQHRDIAYRVIGIRERLRVLIYGDQPEKTAEVDKPCQGNILDEIMAQQEDTISSLNSLDQFITDEIAGKIG